MKKAIFRICAVIISILATTITASAERAFPQWIQNKIKESETNKHDLIEIIQYEHQGTKKYLLITDIDDDLMRLYDSKGNFICAPWGGETGLGDRRCPKLKEQLHSRTSIWKSTKEGSQQATPNPPLEPSR